MKHCLNKRDGIKFHHLRIDDHQAITQMQDERKSHIQAIRREEVESSAPSQGVIWSDISLQDAQEHLGTRTDFLSILVNFDNTICLTLLNWGVYWSN